MFANLLKEMKRANPKITQNDIAKLLGLSPRAISDRFANNVEWKNVEMLSIKKEKFPNLTLEYLFEKI